MTASGFRKFIQPLSTKKCLSKIPHSSPRLRIGIDATEAIYKALYFWKGGGSQSIVGLVKLASRLCTNLIPREVNAIAVFDGQRVAVKGKQRSSLLDQVESYHRSHYFGVETNFTIPPSITHAVARNLTNQGIQCLVAPFEADAQLAYLSNVNAIDAVLSLDADSLIFGCDVYLEKYDATRNTVELTHRKDVLRAMGEPTEAKELLQPSCALGGSDYSRSLRGVHFIHALSLLNEYKSLEELILRLYDAFLVRDKKKSFNTFPKKLQGIVRHILNDMSDSERFEAYLAEFTAELRRALCCFRHHIVYDPNTRAFTRLNLSSLQNRSLSSPATPSFRACGEYFSPEQVHSMVPRVLMPRPSDDNIKSVFGSVFPEKYAVELCEEFSLALK